MAKSFLYIFYLLMLAVLSSCSEESCHHKNDALPLVFVRTIETEDTVSPPDMSFSGQWEPGVIVDSAVIYNYGIEKCFLADTISDSLFSSMKDVSFHDDTPVTRKDLRYLQILHYNSEGEIIMGEMICNHTIASDLLKIFRELFDARFPIERMRLACRYGGNDEKSMSDNNTSCFNSRSITGGSKYSYHAYGLAVDINPLYNPYIKTRNGAVVKILPSNAKLSDSDSPYRIKKGDICYCIFLSHGFKWGGSWRSVKDYQHFEKHK